MGYVPHVTPCVSMYDVLLFLTGVALSMAVGVEGPTSCSLRRRANRGGGAAVEELATSTLACASSSSSFTSTFAKMASFSARRPRNRHRFPRVSCALRTYCYSALSSSRKTLILRFHGRHNIVLHLPAGDLSVHELMLVKEPEVVALVFLRLPER